jgi:hypothetical protein
MESISEPLLHLLDDRVRLPAVRTLIVAELDQLHWRRLCHVEAAGLIRLRSSGAHRLERAQDSISTGVHVHG